MLVALNRPSQLRIETRNYDGDLTAASGSVTVTVIDYDGDNVGSGSASSTATGIYAWQLPSTVTGTLGTYEATAVYTVAGETSSVTYAIETVGNYLFEINELRDFDVALTAADYPAYKIREARDRATEVLERSAQVAFAPRRKVETLSGDNTTRLLMPDVLVSDVHSVTLYGEDNGVDLADEVLDAVELADVEIDGDAGVLVRTDGLWPRGHRNVVVDYTYGYSSTPMPVKRAAMLLAVEHLVPSALPLRATAQATDLGDFRISLANPDAGRDTGIPEVDAVIATWGFRRPRIR
jgi:hypothetical protein